MCYVKAIKLNYLSVYAGFIEGDTVTPSLTEYNATSI